MKLRLLAPREQTEAESLIQWAHYRLWTSPAGHRYRLTQLLLHVPNGAYLGHDPRVRAITMGKLKAAGLRPGCFDYFLAVPTLKLQYPGAWIELKRLKGGIVSPEQRDFERDMRELGWWTVIARGWIEASVAIDRYLALCSDRPSYPMGNERPNFGA